MSSNLCEPCYNALLGSTKILDKGKLRFLWGPTRGYVTRVCKAGTTHGGEFEYFHHGPASCTRRRKGNPVPGGITGRPSSWRIEIWGTGPPGWGSLESERVKYVCPRVPRDSDPRMTALARTSSNCKGHTPSLVRESAPHQQTRNSLTVITMWS
jgi:hypothetical protein